MSCQFTKEDLIYHAKRLAKKHWNRELDVKIELVNREWKRKMASYIYNRSTGEKIIRMSKITNMRYSDKVVLNNLLHELVHWHLHTTGKPYGDGDREFVAECMRVGAPISGTKVAKQALELYIRDGFLEYIDNLQKQKEQQNK